MSGDLITLRLLPDDIEALLTLAEPSDPADADNVGLYEKIKAAQAGIDWTHLEYLDKLRASGITNMFGAAQNLELEFGLTYKQARLTLQYWMVTFGDGGYVAPK